GFRTRLTKSARAWNAASVSRATANSRLATILNVTRPRKSRQNYEQWIAGLLYGWIVVRKRFSPHKSTNPIIHQPISNHGIPSTPASARTFEARNRRGHPPRISRQRGRPDHGQRRGPGRRSQIGDSFHQHPRQSRPAKARLSIAQRASRAHPG